MNLKNQGTVSAALLLALMTSACNSKKEEVVAKSNIQNEIERIEENNKNLQKENKRQQEELAKLFNEVRERTNNVTTSAVMKADYSSLARIEMAIEEMKKGELSTDEMLFRFQMIISSVNKKIREVILSSIENVSDFNGKVKSIEIKDVIKTLKVEDLTDSIKELAKSEVNEELNQKRERVYRELRELIVLESLEAFRSAGLSDMKIIAGLLSVDLEGEGISTIEEAIFEASEKIIQDKATVNLHEVDLMVLKILVQAKNEGKLSSDPEEFSSIIDFYTNSFMQFKLLSKTEISEATWDVQIYSSKLKDVRMKLELLHEMTDLFSDEVMTRIVLAEMRSIEVNQTDSNELKKVYRKALVQMVKEDFFNNDETRLSMISSLNNILVDSKMDSKVELIDLLDSYNELLSAEDLETDLVSRESSLKNMIQYSDNEAKTALVSLKGLEESELSLEEMKLKHPLVKVMIGKAIESVDIKKLFTKEELKKLVGKSDFENDQSILKTDTEKYMIFSKRVKYRRVYLETYKGSLTDLELKEQIGALSKDLIQVINFRKGRELTTDELKTILKDYNDLMSVEISDIVVEL